MSPSRILPRRVFLSVLTVLFLVSALGLGASDLHVRVIDVDTERGGIITAGVYASEEGYLEPGYQVAGIVIPITGNVVEGVFSNLPEGRYVVAILHDENGDREMQTKGALGIPTEGYGFSGPSKAKMKPPKFNNVAIPLDGSDSVEVDIFMKYM